MEPEIRQLEPMKLVGVSEDIDLDTGDLTGVKKAWDRLCALPSDKIDHLIDDNQFWGMTFGIHTKRSCYVAARAVGRGVVDTTGLRVCMMPQQTFAMFEYHGHCKKIPAAIKDALDWLETSDYTLDGHYVLERYDNRCDPDRPDQYVVEIYIPIKENPD